MKQQYKTNMITKSQRAIAYFLLICQLLTSCGGKDTLLPRDPNAQLTTTVNEQQAICLEYKELEGYNKPTSFIDATPLKLGQEEIRFAWDDQKGLQAFTLDPSMGSRTTPMPIKIPTIINPGNGCKKIFLGQLNKKQAEAVVKNFKWEVNKKRELKEIGGRLRGGMEQSESNTPQGSQWTPSLSRNSQAVINSVQKGKAPSKAIEGGVRISGDTVNTPLAKAKTTRKLVTSTSSSEVVRRESGTLGSIKCEEIGSVKGGVKDEERESSKGKAATEKKSSSDSVALAAGQSENTQVSVISQSKSEENNLFNPRPKSSNQGHTCKPEDEVNGQENKSKQHKKNTGSSSSREALTIETDSQKVKKDSWKDIKTGEIWDPMSEKNVYIDPQSGEVWQKRDSESSASSSNIFHSQCTDCSPNSSQHQNYHEPVLAAVRDFFETHFKRSPFLPQVKIMNITHHPHHDLACIHNSKKRTTEQTATQSGKSYPSDMVNMDEDKLKGLNMVTASLTFLKVDGISHKKILIKCPDIPVKQAFDDEDRRGKDKFEKKEYHDQIIEDFNRYIANLLKNEPGLLKQTITSKKQPRGKKDITNPLLKKDGKSYNNEINVYDIIKQEVVNQLVAKGIIEGGRELTSEEERIIVKSIVSARKHAEEGLSRYMRSPEFENELKKQLNDNANYEGDLKSLVQKFKLNEIEMDVHSTLESCLPCQVALRAVRQYLEEKLFPPDEAQAREAAAVEEDLRNPVKERVILRISSQQVYKTQHKRKYIYDEDLKAIQYEANAILSGVKFEEGNEVKVNEATGFMNGPFDRISNLGESASGSANSQRVKELTLINERLATVVENKTAEAEEARKKEASTKASIAIKMIKKGNTNIDDIADTTGLSTKEVSQLKAELDSKTATSSAGNQPKAIDKE